jgi:toxin ParE1/3/4
MKRKLVILPRARAELYDGAEYISVENEDLSRRFLAAADATFADLLATPGLGRVREFHGARLHGLRSWRIRGFENWLVFYRVTEEAVEILRVLHGARDLEALFEAEEGDL